MSWTLSKSGVVQVITNSSVVILHMDPQNLTVYRDSLEFSQWTPLQKLFLCGALLSSTRLPTIQLHQVPWTLICPSAPGTTCFRPPTPTPLQVWQMPPGRMLFSTHVLSLEDRAQDRLLSSLGLLFCFWVNYTYYCPSESFLECKPYCFCSLVYPQYLNSAWNKGGVWKFVKWIQWRCEFSCLSYRTCKMFYRKNIMI